MSASTELLTLMKQAIAAGECATMAEAYPLVMGRNPSLAKRHQAAPQAVAKGTAPPPMLVSKEEREHWAILKLKALVDQRLAKYTTPLTPSAAWSQVLASDIGQHLTCAYDDHRAGLIAAARGGKG